MIIMLSILAGQHLLGQSGSQMNKCMSKVAGSEKDENNKKNKKQKNKNSKKKQKKTKIPKISKNKNFKIYILKNKYT